MSLAKKLKRAARTGLVSLLSGVSSLGGCGDCRNLTYSNLGFPQGLADIRFEIGQGEHCFGLNLIYHSILGFPVAPAFPFPIPDANCEESNPAPSLTTTSEPEGGPFDGMICASTRNILHGDVRFGIRAEDSDEVTVGANVYRFDEFAAQSQQLIPVDELAVINEGEFGLNGDRFYAQQNFKVVPVYPDAVPTGHYVLGIFATDGNKTTSWMRQLSIDNGLSCKNVVGLGDAIDFACGNLQRATNDVGTTTINEGSDTRIYWIRKEGSAFLQDGTYLPELDKQDPYSADGTIHHILQSGPTNGRYAVAVAGTALGNVLGMFSGIDGLSDSSRYWGPTGNSAYNPGDCRHLLFLNPKIQDIPTGELVTVNANGQPGTFDSNEVVRTLP